MSRLSNTFPYFTNDKGQYYIPCWDVIESLEGVPETHAQIIRSLPVVTVERSYWTDVQGHQVLSLLPAKNFLDVNKLSIQEAEMKAYFNDDMLQALKAVYKATKNPVAKKLQTITSGLDKGLLTRNMFDAVSEFGEGDCVALFCADKDKEGFIQKNGDVGALSKAMIFNNERDAESAVNRLSAFWRFSQFQIVKVEMSVAKLGGIIEIAYGESCLDTSVIASVESAVQKKSLQRALEQVSRDEIEQELQKRNAAPDATKRRM